MDLRTVYSRLTSVALEESRLKQDGPFLSNITAFKTLVESLADVPAFATRADNFRNSPLARVGGDQATWDESQTNTIRELGDQFCHSAVGLRDALAVLVKPLPPESIVVKLPPEIDLASVVDTLQKIEQALVVLVREPQIGGHVVVERWETGPLLLVLSLGAGAAVALVARVLCAGVVVYEEIQKGRMMSQHVRGLKIRKDMAEEMDRLKEKFIKDLVEQEGRAVESHAFGDHERVRCEHIKNSIRLFADLIARGTTVYPAPEMPPEQAQHFPVY